MVIMIGCMYNDGVVVQQSRMFGGMEHCIAGRGIGPRA